MQAASIIHSRFVPKHSDEGAHANCSTNLIRNMLYHFASYMFVSTFGAAEDDDIPLVDDLPFIASSFK